MKFLEQSSISPPSGSIPNTTIPLTYFDLAELMVDSPLHEHYFYELKTSDSHFMQSILPGMKHSLALTLKHFYPLAGHLIWSPESSVPQLVYVDGDSVSFSSVESDYSFDHVSGNHPQEATDFIPLSSQLLPQSSATAGVQYPVYAVRVTLFPNSGICVGTTMSHVIGDGMAFNLCTKYWASLCNSLLRESSRFIPNLLPSFDKSTIVDPYGIEMSYLNHFKEINITPKNFNLPPDAIISPADPNERKVVATFILDSITIQKLKKWVLKQMIEKDKQDPCFNLTTVVVTCAFMWACMIKALDSDNVTNNSTDHFIIPVDCRSRIDPPLPETYFGNCLMVGLATIRNNDLLGDNGIVLAAEAIGKTIKTLVQDVLAPARDMLKKFSELGSERICGVACTPKMRVYETNFGWGNPKKYEPIILFGVYSHYQFTFMRENGSNGNGGVEFGLAMKKHQMEAFTSIFNDTLSRI